MGLSAHTCRWGSKPIPLQHSWSWCMTFEPQQRSVTVALPAGCIVGYPSLPTQQRVVEEFTYSWPQQMKPETRENMHHAIILFILILTYQEMIYLGSTSHYSVLCKCRYWKYIWCDNNNNYFFNKTTFPHFLSLNSCLRNIQIHQRSSHAPRIQLVSWHRLCDLLYISLYFSI